MEVQVEFYGVPRIRAGVAESRLRLSSATATLSMLLERLAEEFPAVAEECFEGAPGARRLRPAYAMNWDGVRFVRRGEEPLRNGQTVLLLAADAGG